MPGTSGLEACACWWKMCRNALSCHRFEDAEDLLETLRAGARSYLRKISIPVPAGVDPARSAWRIGDVTANGHKLADSLRAPPRTTRSGC
jgi:hypothetical protein